MKAAADDLYSLLGVARDAKPAAIKTAYRRAAKAAHPDAPGGDHATFVAIGQAYRVLSDPEMRAHYDATGSVDQKAFQTAEDLFRQVLLNGFNQVVADSGDRIEEVDIIASLRNGIDNEYRSTGQGIASAKARIAKLDRLKERIQRADGGRNLFAEAVAHQARQIDEGVRQGERKLRVLNLCRDELAAYSSIVEMTQAMNFFFIDAGTYQSSSTSGNSVYSWSNG